MPHHRLETFKDPAALAENVALWLVSRARVTQGRFSIALSGGSTPQRLFEVLASAAFARDMPWERTHLFWGDDRHVPHDDEASNYRMAREALITRVPLPPGNVHPVPFLANAADSAAAYQRELQTYYGSDALDMSRPLFDVVLLGLGEDGHTASLFPGNPALDETNDWVVGLTDPSVPQPRVTLTYPAIACSRAVAFLVEGSKKAAILRRALDGDRALPSARVTSIGELTWFTDEAALS